MYKEFRRHISNLTLVVLSLILCFACSGEQKKAEKVQEKAYKYASMKDGILHLDVDKSRKDSAIMNLSSICDSLIYIPLETNSKSIIGGQLNEFYIDGDDMFLQYSWKAYRFKTDGKFVCQFGKLGRGPGEYTCTGLTVNPVDKRVYVKANYKHRMFTYDYNGKLISDKVKIGDSHAEMIFYPKTKSVLYTSAYSFDLKESKKSNYDILKSYDLEGKLKTKIKSKYFPDKFFTEGKGSKISIPGASMYNIDNEMCVQEVSSDTLFKWNGDSLRPHIVINSSDFKEPFNSRADFGLPNNGMWWFISGLPSLPIRVKGESSRFVFMDDYSAPAYVYDKEERCLSCIQPYIEYEEGEKAGEKIARKKTYYNDIDGLNHLRYTWVINNKYLLYEIEAVDFLERVEGMKDNNTDSVYAKRMKEIAANLTEESNAVLMLARIKK
jgi:hypothetical protein